MARTKVSTASGVISAKHGQLFKVNVSKVGTGASSIIIYDNASAASGDIVFQGDGLAQVSFDLTNGSGDGVFFTNGLYITLAGTTVPTVSVICS